MTLSNKFKQIDDLKAICQPHTKISRDPIIGKLLYRKLRIYLTVLFVYLGFSANIVTLLGISTGLLGISLFALSPDVYSHFAGVVLLQISIVMDYSDGEIARYRRYQDESSKGKNTLSGDYLDNMGHYILTPLGVFFLDTG